MRMGIEEVSIFQNGVGQEHVDQEYFYTLTSIARQALGKL